MATPTFSRTTEVTLVARDYQLELLEVALKRNTIVVLDTGTGKTFIAIMLLQYLATQENNRVASEPGSGGTPRRRLGVFLVNMVPLVTQQAHAIRTHSRLRVQALCGGSRVNTSFTPETWVNEMNHYDVLVLTAQVFLDMLRHGLITMDMFHLVVFDECHHTRKSHPYNSLMREFYFPCPKEYRPKIFGLTASPLSLQTNVELCARTLEAHLDATIHTVHPTLVQRIVNKPREIELAYDPSPVYPATLLMQALHHQYGGLYWLDRSMREATRLLEELGPWCADAYWDLFYQPFNVAKMDITMRQPHISNGILDNVKILVKQHSLAQQYPKPPLESNYCSPKLLTFVRALISSKVAKSFRCIVFVNRRITVLLLYILVQRLPELQFLCAALMVGHGWAQPQESISMKINAQKRVMGHFRAGRSNLLLATEVAGEGIDIQACNTVIRFDLFDTVVAYIQSRGRARHENSAFVIMMERGNAAQYDLVRRFRTAEAEMQGWCLKSATKPLDDNLVESAEFSYTLPDTYLVESTGARTTMSSAVSLLHHYCSTLPGDEHCCLQPLFTFDQDSYGFRAIVTLPVNAPLRTVVGDPMPSKTRAKQSAALHTCAQLHHMGELTDRLLPKLYVSKRQRRILSFGKSYLADLADKLFHQDESGEDDEPNRASYESGKSRYRTMNESTWYPQQTTAKAHHETEQVWYPTVLQPVMNTRNCSAQATQYRTWLLLTQEPLAGLDPPSNFISLYQPQVDGVNVIPFDQTFPMDLNQRDKIHKFTLSLFSDMSNRSYWCDLSHCAYLAAPLVDNATLPEVSQAHFAEKFSEVINWSEIDSLLHDLHQPLYPKDYMPSSKQPHRVPDLVVLDSLRNSKKYFVDAVRTDMSPWSPMPPEETAHVPNQKFDHFVDYYRRRYTVYEDDATFQGVPMLQVSAVGTAADYTPPAPQELDEPRLSAAAVPAPLPKTKKPGVGFLIPLLSRRHALRASTYRSALLLPTVLHHLGCLVRAARFRLTHQLSVRLDYLTQVFTLPQVNRNVCCNYERLEYLGDTMLKLLASLNVFVSHPLAHEGKLTEYRYRLLSNRCLFRFARRVKLEKFVNDTPFAPRTWRPPRFLTDSEIQRMDETNERLKQRAERVLGHKAMADLVEATLGACYLSNGLDALVQCALKFGLPLAKVEKWADFYTVYLQNCRAVVTEAPDSSLVNLLSVTATDPSQPLSVPVNDVHYSVLTAQTDIDYDQLESTIHYRFRNRRVLAEALTHPSAIQCAVGCYQRLELLGDAVLDTLTIRHLYQRYPTATPNLLTNMRVASVNNNFLATICHALQLHRYLVHFSPTLVEAIDQYIQHREQHDGPTLTTAIGKDMDGATNPVDSSVVWQEPEDESQLMVENDDHGKPKDVGFEYWFDLEPPKVMGDLLESLLGAIFVDNEMDLSAPEAFYNRFIRPVHNRYITPNLVYIHAVSKLIHYISGIGCKQFSVENFKDTSPPSKNEESQGALDEAAATCTIYIHDHPVFVTNSFTFHRARQLAGMRFLAELRSHPTLLTDHCTCHQEPTDTNGEAIHG
ncbi:Dicer-like protein 1 [Dispira simplex]|nr:Dicer-like protein 1 [Dispira simplex]